MNPLPPRNRIHPATENSVAVRIPIFAKCFWLKSLLVLLCMMDPLSADQFEDFTYTSNGSAITITGYTGVGGEVVIPSTIVGLPVTTFGFGAFSNKTAINSVVIPNSVTDIGQSTFQGCSGLTSVNIPSGVTVLYNTVFGNCTSLTAITIPAGVVSMVYAFSGCSSLVSATFLGNAPTYVPSVFQGTAPGFTVYFTQASTGFTTPTWQGYPSVNLGPNGGLAIALDAPGLSFATGGDATWTGQSLETHDGVDAAVSGGIWSFQTTWMETTVTGPGTF